MENSEISTCITSLYGSQPSSVVFACKTATFGLEYKSLWVQDITCHFVHAKQLDLQQNDKFTLVPTLICVFVHAKQRILDQNFKSLWVPALICGVYMPNSEFWPRITSLYGSQTSPALLCNQNGVICTRISSLYWFQPSSVVLCLQNSDFRTRLTSLYGSQTSSVVLSTHNSVLSTILSRL